MQRTIQLLLRSLTLSAISFTLTATVVAIDFDSSFGDAGKFVTSYSDTGNPSSFAGWTFIQPSGRILLAGIHTQQGTDGRVSGIAIAGLTTGGALDSNYGVAGKVLNWSSISSTLPIDYAMQPDGSLLVFHQFFQVPATLRADMIRYTANGQPDGTFNADLNINGTQTTPVRMTLTATGKIYALVRLESTHYLIRLNGDGSRDTAFGPAGIRVVDLNRVPANQRQVTGLHELEGGKIVVSGYYRDLQTFYSRGFVIRFNNDTHLDRSFGLQGVLHITIPDGDVGFQRLAVAPDGKILLAGYYTFLGSNALVVRVNTRGRLDTSFGEGGVARYSFGNVNAVRGIKLTSNGKVYIVGSTSDKAVPSNQRLFIARLSSTGFRESFLVTNFLAGQDAGGTDLAFQSDGKIVASGFAVNTVNVLTQTAAARFNP